MSMQASWPDWRAAARLGSASLPTWWPGQPVGTAQILDVRKVRRIDSGDVGRTRIKFTTTDRRIGYLSCILEPLTSGGKANLDEREAKRLLTFLKASFFQFAVEDDVIVAARLREVLTSPFGDSMPIPIEPERRSATEALYKVWLPEVTDHEYVFLRDCELRESRGSALSADQIKRISSIRRRCMCRNLFSHPYRI
ncbi:hypothetical protein ACFLSW_03745 [Candidatus Bipolaricaulota bacterium]